MRHARLAAAVCAAALAPGLALGQPARTRFDGCPLRATEPGCVLVRGPGGQLFDLTSARPPIRFNGLGVRGSGVRAGVSHCMRATPLVDIRYASTSRRCEAPRGPARQR